MSFGREVLGATSLSENFHFQDSEASGDDVCELRIGRDRAMKEGRPAGTQGREGPSDKGFDHFGPGIGRKNNRALVLIDLSKACAQRIRPQACHVYQQDNDIVASFDDRQALRQAMVAVVEGELVGIEF